MRRCLQQSVQGSGLPEYGKRTALTLSMFLTKKNSGCERGDKQLRLASILGRKRVIS